MNVALNYTYLLMIIQNLFSLKLINGWRRTPHVHEWDVKHLISFILDLCDESLLLRNINEEKLLNSE